MTRCADPDTCGARHCVVCWRTHRRTSRKPACTAGDVRTLLARLQEVTAMSTGCGSVRSMAEEAG